MDLNTETLTSDAICITLAGRLDTPGVDRVETRFNAAAVANNQNAAIDLSAVSFVSSMGVRMLIGAARAMQQRGHRMVLFGAPPLVQETLDNVALDQLIPLVADRAAALQVLQHS